ncbi:chemotaxis protein CheD [Bacillus timonensis]|nr:chemotaxis protein CheD [Bacillus timonensis]
MIDQGNVVKVGIADLNVIKSPFLIRTSGLGSCVGVIIYDQYKEIAGLAHVMLPDSSLTKNGTLNIAKFADTAIPQLIKEVVNLGAKSSSLRAKIAGGAQMFQFSSGNDIMRIGPRNIEAVKAALNKCNIEIVSSDVGGNSGRTIEFDPTTRLLTVRKVNMGITQI